MNDQYDQEAEALLPCAPQCGDINLHIPAHVIECPVSYRPAVAARLREADGECVNRLTGLNNTIEAFRSQLAQAQAEIERLRNDLSDALDVKAGHGPTVLTDMANEIERLKAANEAWHERVRAGIDVNEEIAALRSQLAEAREVIEAQEAFINNPSSIPWEEVKRRLAANHKDPP